jgi:hypothetical protein
MSKRIEKRKRRRSRKKPDTPGIAANSRTPIFGNGGNLFMWGRGEVLPVFCYWEDSIPCSHCPDRYYHEGPEIVVIGQESDTLFGDDGGEAPPAPVARRRKARRRARS